MIGSAIYGYRNNFGCKAPNRIPKKKKYNVKLIDLLRDGYRTVAPYEDDLFIGICQWLMKNGYPCGLNVSDKTDNIDEFLMEVLFSVNPFHYENLMINKSGFDLLKWRKKINLFKEIEIEGLNYYRNRASMPFENFTSFSDIKKIIFTKRGKYNDENIKLKFSFNSSWKNAVWIIGKDCFVSENTFTYRIFYGCKDDYNNAIKGKAHSSWKICIESEPNENYIDFCLRIHDNYDRILSGDKSVLISQYYNDEEKNFYLGGNFRLRMQTQEFKKV